MTTFEFAGITYVLVLESGCVCDKCAFNHMDASGAVACQEAPDCNYKGYYVEQSKLNQDGTVSGNN
jgi:hypothetical protein